MEILTTLLLITIMILLINIASSLSAIARGSRESENHLFVISHLVRTLKNRGERE